MEKNNLRYPRGSFPFPAHSFEERALTEGLLPCGIDEVGRGPLAGPLVAASAMVVGGHHPLLRDSKLLSVAQREEAYRWLLQNSYFGVGIISSQQIDHLGIIKANISAMERSFFQLVAIAPRRPAFALVDAVPLKFPQELFDSPPADAVYTPDPLLYPWRNVISFPHSEELSYSIAAASIIAKVTRDRLMAAIDGQFPLYTFAQHKGYGTAQHRRKLIEQGRSILHRKSFTKNI